MAEKADMTLTDFLVGGVPVGSAIPDSTVIVANDPQSTTPAIVQEIVNALEGAEAATEPIMDMVFPDEEMLDLMAKVKRIGMCAKDLHYRAKGKPFYGLHLLADLAYQVEEDTDHIAEVYFMGDRGLEPPRMTQVFGRANSLVVLYPEGDNYFIGGLMDICRITMHSIEDIKQKFDVKSGVAAVLDKISEHCLLAIGLLDQTMKGG